MAANCGRTTDYAVGTIEWMIERWKEYLTLKTSSSIEDEELFLDSMKGDFLNEFPSENEGDFILHVEIMEKLDKEMGLIF